MIGDVLRRARAPFFHDRLRSITPVLQLYPTQCAGHPGLEIHYSDPGRPHRDPGHLCALLIDAVQVGARLRLTEKAPGRQGHHQFVSRPLEPRCYHPRSAIAHAIGDAGGNLRRQQASRKYRSQGVEGHPGASGAERTATLMLCRATNGFRFQDGRCATHSRV